MLQKNSVVKELIKDSAWSVIGTVVSKTSLFLVWIIVARILTSHEYGQFSIIKNTTFLFSEYIALSISVVVSKYVAECYNHDRLKLESYIFTFLVLSIVLGGLGSLLLYIFSSQISSELIKAPELSQYIKCTSVVILVSVFNNCQLAILRGLGAFKTISLINLYQVVFSFPAYVVCTYFCRLDGTIGGYVFYYIIICIITQYKIRKIFAAENIHPRGIITGHQLKNLFNFTMPYFFSVLIPMACQWLNEVLISQSKSGFKQMAFYSVSYTFQTLVVAATTVVCIPFVSKMVKYKNSSNNDLLEKINLYVPIFLASIFSLPLILFPELFVMLYGSQYSSLIVYKTVSIMAFTTPFVIYRQSLSRLILVKDKQLFYLLDTLIMGVIAVLLFHFYYVRYLAVGLAFTNLVVNIVSVVLFTPIYVRIRLLKRDYLKSKIIVACVITIAISIVACLVFMHVIVLRIVILLISLFSLLFILQQERKKNYV